ncbi:MAG TPA: glycoside hydrolase family 20 zincin-like fold domain-containing protein [Lentisphaeria bacterium]|nr:glycoside hydrolase family 20 zincin-like fold domain-containing protein [Lentisphaeria bacterium]
MSAPIIIPTPVESHWDGGQLVFQKFFIEGKCTSEYALERLGRWLHDEGSTMLRFQPSPGGDAQAYELVIDAAGVTMSAADSDGFRHGAMTLLQLLTKHRDGWALPLGRIADRPHFEIRGINWNLMAEIRGWSQDDCHASVDFHSRFLAGLDLMATYKLNFAFVDGVGWNARRFHSYPSLMRELNAEARHRGIHLCYVGYSSGYGEQHEKFDGESFENRHDYPNGPLYPCMGFAAKPVSQLMGTCLSNNKLLEQKCAQLQQFVQAVEPGALYVHGLDISVNAEAQASWNLRCPDCRKRWPNDDLAAPDGMAGACANLFRRLADAVGRVRNRKTDYDARRDCMINMVGPNYTNAYENDDEWRCHLDYFETVSRRLAGKNIYLMLREQFFGDVPKAPRYQELRQRLGPDAKISCVYFAAGAGFYDSSIISGDAPAIGLLSGANAVITGNGNAFQETRQVINAEYLWNPDGAFRVDLPAVAVSAEFMPAHRQQAFGISSPPQLFAAGGLLDVACAKLYGKAAGALVARAQRLRTSHGDKYSHTTPLWNATFPNWRFSNFKLVRWQAGLTPEALAQASELQALLKELVKLNQQAAKLYGQACEKAEKRWSHLARMAETCDNAVKMQRLMVRWLGLFLEAAAGRRPLKRLEALQEEVRLLHNRLQRRRSFAMDPNGGDIGFAAAQMKLLGKELRAIAWTLKNPGKFRSTSELIYGTQRQ